MPRITYAGQSYESTPNESILECMSRQGVELPHGCRAGICQSCLMQATDGTPPPESQQKLRPQLQQQGYFLACLCKPTQDLSFCAPEDSTLPKTPARLIDKTSFNDNILRLRFQPQNSFEYQAGQFINLHRSDGLIRSYSIASLPESGYLELHVELLPDGKMSGWLNSEMAVGDSLDIDGPHGECYYSDSKPTQNMLLVGTGTGLAPLWGIIQTALARHHTGEIHLFHGSREPQKLYLVDALTQLAAEHPNFFYTPCISGSGEHTFSSGRANELALAQHNKLDDWQVYLCGHPDMVNNTRKKAFLAGAAFNDIHADPFTPAA